MEFFNRRPSAFASRVPQRPGFGRPERSFEGNRFAPSLPFEASRDPWHHRVARAFGINLGQPAQPYGQPYGQPGQAYGAPATPLGQLPQGPLPPNVDGHQVSRDAHRIFELQKARDPRAAQAMRILHKLVLQGDQVAKATLDLVLRMRATVTGGFDIAGDFDIAGAFRPAPPRGGGRGRPAAPGRGYRPAPPVRRGGYRPLAPAIRRPWAPAMQPAWDGGGVPVFGPGGSATYMDPGALDAMEAASTPVVIPAATDTSTTDASQTTDASTDAAQTADAAGAYFRPFHALARKDPTWYHPGMNVGSGPIAADASGAHGWSGGRRAGYRGWAGAGRGWGLYGGAWPGAYVPVWNPAIVDPETWAAQGEIALPPSAPDASGASGDYIDRQDYDGLWPYKMNARALAGAPICAPGDAYGALWPYHSSATEVVGTPLGAPICAPGDAYGPIWDYGLGGQLGGLWPYRSCATAVAGAGAPPPGTGASPDSRGISGVVTAHDLIDAIARIEHAAAVINHDVNANPPSLPGAADAWRTYVTALLGRLANLRQANKDVFSAGAIADLLVTEAAGLNAARQLLATQGAVLTTMAPLVLPFAGPSASSGVWHWATFGVTLGSLVALDKITRAIRHRYGQQMLAAKAAAVKAPGAVTGLWSWPTMWWTLGGTTLLDVLTRDKVWARSKLAEAASHARSMTSSGGPSNLLIIASPPPPPPPPTPTTPSPAVPMQDASGAWWTIPAAALGLYGAALAGYGAYRYTHAHR